MYFDNVFLIELNEYRFINFKIISVHIDLPSFFVRLSALLNLVIKQLSFPQKYHNKFENKNNANYGYLNMYISCMTFKFIVQY